MPCYAFHMNKGAHHCVYHRKICIRHSVIEVVHSQYPGKQQRLNIRIYFDRKNKYFYSNAYSHYKSTAFQELLFTQMTNNFETNFKLKASHKFNIHKLMYYMFL